MARTGRPPKTIEQRKLEGGTKRKGAISKKPVPDTVVLAPRITAFNKPERPDDLTADGIELWDLSIQALIDINAAQTIDVPALRNMVFWYEVFMSSQRVIRQQGPFVTGSMGQMVEHPGMKMAKESSALFLRFAGDFGLTTLARTRLGYLENARRSLEHDLNAGLGTNPRKALPAASGQ